MMFNRKRAWFALALSLGAPLNAQSSPIIVTAQRAADIARDQVASVPGGADLVDAAEFRDRLAVSLRDALSFSPGVYAQPRFGQEVRISIRGSGISRGYHMRGLTLLQDGIPINLADDNGDFQEFDPQIFERILVFRGANALRYGGSTLGGAIDAITPTGRTAPGLSLRLDGGSFGTVRALAAYGFGDTRGDGFLAVTSDRSRGDRAHAHRDSIRLNGNAGLQISAKVATRFYVTLNHIDQDLPGALGLGEVLSHPRRANASSVAGDQERDIDSIRLQNQTTIALADGSLAFGGFYNVKTLFHPIYQVVDQKADDRGAFVALDLAGAVLGVPVELSLGGNARWGTVEARQYVNSGGRRGARTLESEQRASTVTSYGEIQVKPIPTLSLIAGGVHVHGRREIDNATQPAASGAVGYDRFAPKAGVLWQLRDQIQVYANYSRSIELPGFIELGQIQTPPLTGFVDLAPQRAWTAEIGTRGRAGIARWDISLYRADLRGELLQFSIAAGTGVPASTFNAGKTRHQGIEAGLDLELARWARLRQVYQLNDFAFRGDPHFGSNRLPVIPRHVYRAEVKLGGGRLSVTPSLGWVPRGAWADYTNSLRVPGYVSFGAAAAVQVRPGVTIFADARNLTARKAVGDLSAVVDYRTLQPSQRAIFYPIERRSFYAGLRAHF